MGGEARGENGPRRRVQPPERRWDSPQGANVGRGERARRLGHEPASGWYIPNYGIVGRRRLVTAQPGPESLSSAPRTRQPDGEGVRSRLAAVLPSIMEPGSVPTLPEASLPVARWPQTSSSNFPRRRGPSSLAGAGRPAREDLAAEPAGQRPCGKRRPPAPFRVVERPYVP